MIERIYIFWWIVIAVYNFIGAYKYMLFKAVSNNNTDYANPLQKHLVITLMSTIFALLMSLFFGTVLGWINVGIIKMIY